MVISFGKHRGKSPALLVLKDPSYVAWMLGQADAYGQMREAQREAARLVRRFDAKPIVEPCWGHPTWGKRCSNLATRYSVYIGTLSLQWWCESCDEYQVCPAGKLVVVRSYSDAVCYVGNCCGGQKGYLSRLIRDMARAKGLPERVGEAQARAFLG
jgi:hypothetical protein